MASPQFAIEAARVEDWPGILALLARVQLPPDGLRDHLATALVARSGGAVVGSAALELYADGALLRSLAVEPRLQGRGLGRRLAQAALEKARALGATHVFLLTETAADFFPRFGFRPVERAQVPSGVRQSIEFTSACPDSALAMALRLA